MPRLPSEQQAKKQDGRNETSCEGVKAVVPVEPPRSHDCRRDQQEVKAVAGEVFIRDRRDHLEPRAWPRAARVVERNADALVQDDDGPLDVGIGGRPRRTGVHPEVPQGVGGQDGERERVVRVAKVALGPGTQR